MFEKIETRADFNEFTYLYTERNTLNKNSERITITLSMQFSLFFANVYYIGTFIRIIIAQIA